MSEGYHHIKSTMIGEIRVTTGWFGWYGSPEPPHPPAKFVVAIMETINENGMYSRGRCWYCATKEEALLVHDLVASYLLAEGAKE